MNRFVGKIANMHTLMHTCNKQILNLDVSTNTPQQYTLTVAAANSESSRCVL